MHSTSSAQHSSIISLLHEGYSLYQIQSRTGLGKSTVARIKKEVDMDKKNCKGGYPSKLSYQDKQSILCQITTGQVDMLFKLPTSLTTSFPTLSYLKQ